MKILSHFSKRPSLFTCAGNRKKSQYIRVDDEDGRVYLKKIGEIDIQDQINSQRPAKVADIINRFMRGDTSALGIPGGFYGDVSGVGDLSDVVDSVEVLSRVAQSASDAQSVADVNTENSEVKSDAES